MDITTEVPTVLLSREGQPGVAFFESLKESYALGCVELAQRWSAVPVRRLSPQEWDEMLTKAPIVADVYCNTNTQVFNSLGEPGALVFKHRDGRIFRHYVSDPGWVSAIKGVTVQTVTPQKLQEIAPNRGVDFHSYTSRGTR